MIWPEKLFTYNGYKILVIYILVLLLFLLISKENIVKVVSRYTVGSVTVYKIWRLFVYRYNWFSNRDITISSMNKTHKCLRYWVQIYCGCSASITFWLKFDIGHVTTTSPFTAVDSMDPIFNHSGTHFDRDVGNFALDVVFEVV